MSRSKQNSVLISILLSFCLGYGAVACMVTGLELNANPLLLALGCVFLAVLCALCAALRRGGWILLGLVAGIAGMTVLFEGFRTPWQSMLGTMFDYYDRAYYIGVPDIFDVSPYISHSLPLLIIAGLVSAVAGLTLMRRWPVALAVFVAILPLATCFVVTDTVPALWAIGLWLFGIVLLLLTHPVRLRDRQQGNKLTAILALPVALALGLLMILVPQQNYQPPLQMHTFEDFVGWMSAKLPYVGQTHDGKLVFGYGTTIPNRVNLDNLGKRELPDTPVLELTADFSGKVYLRGIDMDQYDGLSWAPGPDREEEFQLRKVWSQYQGLLNIRVLGSRSYQYVPYWPSAGVTLTGGQLVNPGYRREYSFQVLKPIDQWEEISAIQPHITTSVSENYLSLPVTTAVEAKKILDRAGISEYYDPVSIARAVDDYVRNCAEYSLNPSRMPASQKDLAIWFLREAERGYCVHFATSAVVLLRAAGVSARYVEGYTADVTSGEVALVRANKAHAWVEYFVPGVGWMILDPTPGVSESSPTEPPTESTVPSETEPTEPTETTATEPSVTEPTKPSATETKPPAETEPPTEPTVPGTTEPEASFPTESSENDPQPVESGGGSRLLLCLGAICLLVLLVIWQWQIRRKRILHCMHRGSMNARALATYRQIRRMAALRKLKPPAELHKLAEKACYSRQGITPEELEAFRSCYEQCAIALRNESWLKKLYYRLILAVI